MTEKPSDTPRHRYHGRIRRPFGARRNVHPCWRVKVLSEGAQKLVEVQAQPGKIDSTRVIEPAVADTGWLKPHSWTTPSRVKEREHYGSAHR